MTLKTPKIDWDFICTWSFRIFMAGMAIGGAYLANVYITKADAQSLVIPYQNFPARIDRLEETSHTHDDKWKDQEAWRRVKDETDTRLTIIQDNQQQILVRQQQMIDRQQNQIEDLNRRRP